MAMAQCELENTAFKSGEVLSYNLYYNWKFVWVKVGTGSLTTQASRYEGKDAPDRDTSPCGAFHLRLPASYHGRQNDQETGGIG